VITGVDTVVEHHPMQVYPQPIVRRSGWTMGGDDAPVAIINNSTARHEAPQQMLGIIWGVLRPCAPFTTYESYRQVFSDWFRRGI
jgi:hypothetical protein